MPSALRRGSFPAKNIEIAVISSNLVKGIVSAVPLIQNLLNQVLVPI